MQIWGCHNTKNPKPIDTKITVGDYVGDIIPHAKIHKDRPSGGVPAYGTVAWFAVCFFVTQNFARVPRLNRRTDFYTSLQPSV